MADFVAVPKRLGGSLAVVIPADVVRQEGFEEGKPVLFSARKAVPRGAVFGLLKGKMPKYTDRSEREHD